jgi:acetyltransferase-like isoleucine patch superfamily enzyme
VKAKLVLAHLISLLPVNALRVALYRALFGYRISGSRIGWRTVIHVARAELDRCAISHHNRFTGPMRLRIGPRTQIGSGNVFQCGWWILVEEVTDPDYDGYGRSLEIGESVHITSGHLFDCAGILAIGDHSCIGGFASQFWTHGPSTGDANIRIGARCYIGSACVFGPGAVIKDNTMVALGSLVQRRFPRGNLLIGGVPAEILRENYDWQTKRQLAAPAAAPPPGAEP